MLVSAMVADPENDRSVNVSLVGDSVAMKGVWLLYVFHVLVVVGTSCVFPYGPAFQPTSCASVTWLAGAGKTSTHDKAPLQFGTTTGKSVPPEIVHASVEGVKVDSLTRFVEDGEAAAEAEEDEGDDNEEDGGVDEDDGADENDGTNEEGGADEDGGADENDGTEEDGGADENDGTDEDGSEDDGADDTDTTEGRHLDASAAAHDRLTANKTALRIPKFVNFQSRMFTGGCVPYRSAYAEAAKDHSGQPGSRPPSRRQARQRPLTTEGSELGSFDFHYNEVGSPEPELIFWTN
ncbi:hypothetical protein SPI_04784 [Niveomyces insectorum RCEF 264]|uniref:Uncharacterized protein n=1 Tax=Niveomyces insectorum RCEF 264 TaxID=1081102 RepID=A0A167UUH8_9HYPO|nr:hypothetical protein SPI_04784 [Niveomyces insectorum RCEF 264]